MLSRAVPSLLALAASLTPAIAAPQAELTINGDFETGNGMGWQYFSSGNSAWGIGSFQPNSGTYHADLFNKLPNSGAAIQQSNLGVGVVQPGDTIAISFSVYMQGTSSQVLVELISETSGGPPSSVELLCGGPQPIPWYWSGYQDFSYVATAGPDVSGGISLRFTADTGSDMYAFVSVGVDDVSVRIVPDPPAGSAYCFGDGSGVACPCGNVGQPGAGCAHSGGRGESVVAGTLTGYGSPTLSNDTFALNVFGCPGSKPGLVVRGNNRVAIPAGDGLLCTTGGSMRSQLQTTAIGATTFTDFNGAPFGNVANLGVPTNFQFWYRDPQGSPCGTGFNFTNAWTVTYQP